MCLSMRVLYCCCCCCVLSVLTVISCVNLCRETFDPSAVFASVEEVSGRLTAGCKSHETTTPSIIHPPMLLLSPYCMCFPFLPPLLCVFPLLLSSASCPLTCVCLSASLPQFSHLLEEEDCGGRASGRKGWFSKTSEKQQKWEESREASHRKGSGRRRHERRGASRKASNAREMSGKRSGKGFYRKKSSQRRTKK